MFADVPAAPPARYRLPPDVAFAPLPGGTALLLDFDGECYALSEEAADLVQRALDSGPGPDGADDAFLDELRQRGLLCAPGEPARRRAGGLLPLLAPPLWLAHRLPLPRAVRAWVLLVLARLSFGLFGWARTVRAWRRCHRRPAPAPDRAAWDRAVRATHELVLRVAPAHLLHMECKERALCSWSLLRAEGWPAALVVGVRPFPVSGHCWCESGAATVGDGDGHAQAFDPVIRYD
jgi:hypothetical protein